MNKRVYGVLGVSAVMANWNADFSGYPKTTSEGQVFGSDKAFKYPMKKMWEDQGEKVLYIKSMCFDEDKNGVRLIPKTLKQRYEQLFDVKDLKEEKDAKIVLSNLFKAIDVKNFGATFAEADNNISIAGAVQFGQGFNKYDNSQAFEQPILSPFRDPKAKEKSAKKKGKEAEEGEEAKNSTLGSKIVSDEAHYFYSFNINPMAYKGFVELGVTDGYTDEDYQNFKKTALTATTSFATNSKAGCENEFGLFVETEEDLYLPNLAEFVQFEKGQDKNLITLNCSQLLNEVKKQTKAVEIYYNPYTTQLNQDIQGAKLFNIFTQNEI
ncbi:type I CRISPR-associated protein Cas7 [Anaerovorax odorimutans]|uniref:Type I CRISPR-associated protein Cas7 n=1 Tax=Anaerovorax odorimutans TaxID=109327 RepID=A0ABT1RLA3_9FIRM|nr:type I CRISPR-associated protein Cas7 [Anaerovorax odorimutans]MCQ4635973.1 type I CRISPR-associated protein Cas7 [Anaerovorax odorimutans]